MSARLARVSANQLDDVELDVALKAALRGDFEVAEKRLEAGRGRAESGNLYQSLHIRHTKCRSWHDTDWIFRNKSKD